MDPHELKGRGTKFDIVVHNAITITVNAEFEIIKNGIICIKDRILQQIVPLEKGRPLPEALHVIDAQGGIVLPGLVNTHSHLPMALFRGLADDLPLMTWLNDHIFPAENKYISPPSVQLGTLISCAEMLLSGTTTCCDGYFHEEAVAQAVRESGMRAVLGHGVIDFPAPGVPNPAENIQKAVAFIKKWKQACPTITPSIFCHSPYTCSAETLQKAKTAANENEILCQIHAAETKGEWEQIHASHGVSPIQYLRNIGVIDDNTLLVHSVWVDSNDIDTIAKQRAGVSHNPASNMKLSSGIAPIPKILNAGISVGLGTDGCASNNTLDLFQEMDTAAKLHKVDTLDPTAMDARTVIKMATIEGARAIGLGDRIGSLEAGKQADLIIIDTDKPHLVPMYSAASHVVYAVIGSDVRNVIIDGKIIVRDRELLTLDIEKTMREIKSFCKSIH